MYLPSGQNMVLVYIFDGCLLATIPQIPLVSPRITACRINPINNMSGDKHPSNKIHKLRIRDLLGTSLHMPLYTALFFTLHLACIFNKYLSLALAN